MRGFGDLTRRAWLGQAALGVLAATGTTAGWAQDPKAPDADQDRDDASERPFGPPNVWGRVMVEDESPEGPWTPLAGVDVRLLPDPRPLLAELERIRQAGRGSWRNHDQAVARILTVLEARQARAKGAGEATFQDATDAWGLFRFSRVPTGDWLLVAILITPYRRAPETRAPKPKASRRGPGFLEESAPAPREAEVWVAPVSVEGGRAARVMMTERARWMAGPVRQN
jgi:hypothetical protein